MGPREESWDGCLEGCGDGGSLLLIGERDFGGDSVCLVGEEFGVISWSGTGVEVASRACEESFSGFECIGIGVSLSVYIGGV